MIQDIYPHKLDNAFRQGKKAAAYDPVMIFRDRSILCDTHAFKENRKLILPEVNQLKILNNSKNWEYELIYAFCIDEMKYYLYLQDIDEEQLNPKSGNGTGKFDFVNLEEIRRGCTNLDGMVFFTGLHLYQWYQSTRYCGRCGKKMVHDDQERAMICKCCGNREYPRLFPAVIVGVIYGKKLLVTKYREGFAPFALIAGFTEIGETLEECVKREVMEETGLKVKNIRYYGSQPWGIAQDILAGFFCEVDGDPEIHMDRNELKLAQWRNKEDIELQPDSFSLTNEMMRAFKCGEVWSA